MRSLQVLLGTPMLLLFAALAAAAAGLGGAVTRHLGAEATVVAACTQGGLQTDFVLDGPSVTAVDVAGFPDDCAGQTARLTLASGDEQLAEATVPVVGETAHLTLPEAVPAARVTSVSIVVSG